MYRKVGRQDFENGHRSRDVSPVGSYSGSVADDAGTLNELHAETEESQPSLSKFVLQPLDDFASIDDSSPHKEGKLAHTSPSSLQILDSNPWRPGYLARIPWLGLFSMISNILCTITSIVVLRVSNYSAIDHWSTYLQPSVWLSVASMLANQAQTLALAEGIIITFWRKAGQGSTLMELHLYASGASFLSALSSLGSMKNAKGVAVAFASILTAISTLRGPILQRSSTVASVLIPTAGNMSLSVAQELTATTNPLGFVTGNDDTVSYLSQNFTDIVLNFTSRAKIYTVASDCGDNCTTDILGFGFIPNCQSISSYFNGSNAYLGSQPQTIFDLSIDDDSEETLTITVKFLEHGLESDVTILSNLTVHRCTLTTCVVNYPVVVTGATIALQGNHSSTTYVRDIEVGDPGENGNSENYDNGRMAFKATSTVVGAYGYYLTQFATSSSNVSFNGNWTLETKGITADEYMVLGPQNWVVDNTTTWKDPMDDILNSVNELAFRTAVQVAQNNPNSTFNQTVPYVGGKATTVYRSNYTLMGIAVGLNCLALLALFPIYYGWWELGRKSTLGVLETAKAFGAPLLKDVDDNAAEEHILKRVGKTRVKYGKLSVSGGAESGFLVQRKGVRGRLQIVEEDRARKPEVGETFNTI